MNCKNMFDYNKKEYYFGNRKEKEGKYSRKSSKDFCSMKKGDEFPTSFCQSFENCGGIVTDNEYEIKFEEDIIEIE